MKKRFTEQQIAFALRQVEPGTRVSEICRKMGGSEPTFYRWSEGLWTPVEKKQFGGMGTVEIHRLKQLKEENRRLKQVVTDLTLDKHMLQ